MTKISDLLRENDIIDFTKIDKMVYEKGLMPNASDAIVNVYLWETFTTELLPKE